MTTDIHQSTANHPNMNPLTTSPSRCLFLTLTLLFMTSSPSHAENQPIGYFSSGQLIGWNEKSLSGKTIYQLVQEKQGTVLNANSSNAASGLFKEVRINLKETPIIHWSWKINNTLKSNNEREKAGDDFAARIYIVFSDGPFFWQTKTLN